MKETEVGHAAEVNGAMARARGRLKEPTVLKEYEYESERIRLIVNTNLLRQERPPLLPHIVSRTLVARGKDTRGTVLRLLQDTDRRDYKRRWAFFSDDNVNLGKSFPSPSYPLSASVSLVQAFNTLPSSRFSFDRMFLPIVLPARPWPLSCS